MSLRRLPVAEIRLHEGMPECSDIHTLSERMPEADVQSLAEEVLRRVATRRDDHPLTAHAPRDDQIDALSHALIATAPETALAIVDGLRSDEVATEALYLTYLAEAARRLGVWWEEDQVSFAEVTIGTSRILAILHVLDRESPAGSVHPHRAALFASVPGETHTLGVRMAADLFRRDGWDIDLEIGFPHDALVNQIVHSDRQFIGLSAGGLHAIPALAKLVVALRVAAPKAAIMVSGQVVNDAEEIVEALAPDFIVADVESARRAMKRYWAQES